MNSEFALSQGAGQKLEFAVRRCNGTAEDIEYLSNGKNFRAVSLLRTGRAKLVEVTETGSGRVIIPIASTLVESTVGVDGVIHFSVVSDGTTGEEWITRLENKGFRLNDYAKRVLRSKDFKPTKGVTIEIAILKGMLFEDNDRITKSIHAFAAERKLEAPNAEVACLIREMFTDEEIEAMGLWWIVVMHEPIKPIKDSGGDLGLLSAGRGSDGGWLYAHHVEPDSRWRRLSGFAFVVS